MRCLALLDRRPVRPVPPRESRSTTQPYYAKGVTFAAFLDAATEHPDDWRTRYSNAAVTADTVSRLRALPARRQLLVVAEDCCSDSTATVPYLARLVDAAPDRLELRVINSRTGRGVMEAHRTPDGRAATPTVVVLTTTAA